MSKKYFVVSDIHSYFTPFIEALNKEGFDVNDSKHILVIAGDIFDRGDDSVRLLNFIKSLPIERRVLIRGNHEYLFKDLLDSTEPMKYQYSNGTVKTFADLANVNYDDVNPYALYRKYKDDPSFNYTKVFYENFDNLLAKVKSLKIYEWFMSKEWVDYFEINNYIIMHSFIPLRLKHKYLYNSVYELTGINPSEYKYNPNWRKSATKDEYFTASWFDPAEMMKLGFFDEEIKNGKTLVCGHFHACLVRSSLEGIESEDCHTYYGKNIIALDACTTVSNFVNVLVIEE